MPHARFSTTIDAPYERVLDLLVDKMEQPKKYVGTILHSTVLERGPDHLLREMYQPAPVELTIRERICRRPVEGGEEVVYEHVDNAAYTGTFRNILLRVPGRDDRAELEYAMDWQPHPGTADKMSDEQARRTVQAGVAHLKHLAEHPPVVPTWVREFFAVVDSLDGDAFGPLLTEDVTFRMGNGPVVSGRDAVVAGNRRITGMFKELEHSYVSVDQSNGRTFVDSWVRYRTLDDAEFVLPFMTVFQRRDDHISSVAIYGDPSPLRYGWPG